MHVGGSAAGTVLGLDPGIDLHIGAPGELQGDARVLPLERGLQLREVVRVLGLASAGYTGLAVALALPTLLASVLVCSTGRWDRTESSR
ncbi:hypothetical protein ACPESR_21825 [Nocardia testacea]|uniref:hypothetical protein n=1 Tax=Nocardia testacea TaxID=248551 RepID=UPI003C2C7B8A